MEQEIKYKVFKIPKRNGKMRTIEQPLGEGMDILKKKLIELEKIPALKPSFFSHAFMKGRNIVTCAKQHKGKKYIIRVDIKDFFNNITYENFRIILNRRAKHYQLTEKDIDKIMDKIKICFKHSKKRDCDYLPQGSPTSPFLSNAYMWLFDWKMAWFCSENNVVFNRYADDVYLSGDDLEVLKICMYRANKNLKVVKLQENFKKRRILKQGKQMNVVGIVLNQNFNIPKKTRKLIRAMLHNSEKSGTPLTLEQKGLINFQNMVTTYKKEKLNNIKVCELISCAKAI